MGAKKVWRKFYGRLVVSVIASERKIILNSSPSVALFASRKFLNAKIGGEKMEKAGKVRAGRLFITFSVKKMEGSRMYHHTSWTEKT